MSDLGVTGVAQDEVLARDLTDRMELLNSEFMRQPIVSLHRCECADVSCSVRLRLDSVEYNLVRRDPRRFVVAPNQKHVATAIEAVVDYQEEYWVVRKLGEALGELDERRRAKAPPIVES